ncbi:hypothetical protein X978_1788 [Burkholderia pseudomallei MSHR3965]|nr:hypothetical protein X978_1788 [Burkholderia pseudomallei MSHR3965]
MPPRPVAPRASIVRRDRRAGRAMARTNRFVRNRLRHRRRTIRVGASKQQTRGVRQGRGRRPSAARARGAPARKRRADRPRRTIRRPGRQKRLPPGPRAGDRSRHARLSAAAHSGASRPALLEFLEFLEFLELLEPSRHSERSWRAPRSSCRHRSRRARQPGPPRRREHQTSRQPIASPPRSGTTGPAPASISRGSSHVSRRSVTVSALRGKP